MVDVATIHILMDFATRLAAARKERGLTQQALADRVGIHVPRSAAMKRGRFSHPRRAGKDRHGHERHD